MNVLALDLSLRASAMVSGPDHWSGDWRQLYRHHVGHSLPRDASEELLIGRLHMTSSTVLSFAERHGCSRAVVENYAFGTQFGRERLGEMGGAVKLALLTRAGITVESFHAGEARKLILGKLPKSDVKDVVFAKLRELGMPLEWSKDEADAFVGYHWALHKAGNSVFSVEPVETKKSRRRAA